METKKKKEKKLPQIPNTVGEFRVVKEVGRGSFGRVYLGMHLANDAYVAIKHSMPGPSNQPQRYNNFLRKEANLLKQLNHPNIINCYKVRKLQKMPLIFLRNSNFLAYRGTQQYVHGHRIRGWRGLKSNVERKKAS